jgi:hypothetical protein
MFVHRAREWEFPCTKHRNMHLLRYYPSMVATKERWYKPPSEAFLLPFLFPGVDASTSRWKDPKGFVSSFIAPLQLN